MNNTRNADITIEAIIGFMNKGKMLTLTKLYVLMYEINKTKNSENIAEMLAPMTPKLGISMKFNIRFSIAPELTVNKYHFWLPEMLSMCMNTKFM